MATTFGANYDYNTEKDSIARRRKVAEAMQLQALRPMQMPTTPMANVSPLAALAPALQAYLAYKTGKSTDDDAKALGERYAKDLSSGMERYNKTSQGYNVPSPMQGPMPDGGAVEGAGEMFGAAPDQKKAIMEALASNHPVLQEMAMKQLQAQKSDRLTSKDLLPYASPKSILSSPDDHSAWTPKEELGEVGGIVYDKNSKGVVKLSGDQPTQKYVGKDLYELNPSTGQYKKLDNAPSVSVSTSVNPVIAGQKEGLKEYWQGAGKKVNALGEVANQAQNNLQTLAEMKNLDANGIFSNTPTGVATFLTNLGQAAGVDVDVKKLGNTETYNALSTDLWQGLVSKYGGNRGVTKEEAVEIKKMLPLAANSPQARQQLFGILENVSKRQISQYKAANKSFANAVKQDDPSAFSEEFQDVFTPQPSQPDPMTKRGKSASPMTLEDYLKSKGR